MFAAFLCCSVCAVLPVNELHLNWKRWKFWLKAASEASADDVNRRMHHTAHFKTYSKVVFLETQRKMTGRKYDLVVLGASGAH